MKRKSILKTYFVEIVFIAFVFIFSSWLMFSTFSYHEGSMLVATKAWSDFGSHIPLIRSFSFGWNFPPQYPIFPGEPIKYHFLFYFFVGMLEKSGIRIDIALNTLSTIGFAGMLIMIYAFCKKVFKNRAAGIISVLLILFNGSLSLFEFFKLHPISIRTIQDVTQNTIFPSFGPYDGKIVSAFWNLNIFTNQRHLAASIALSLFILYQLVVLRKNQRFTTYIFLGILLGISFYFLTALFLMTCMLLCYYLFVYPEIGKKLLITIFFAILIAYPQYAYLNTASSNFSISIIPGYLIASNLNIKTFVAYWIMNLGFYFFLIPIAFLYVSLEIKKIFLGFFLLFLVGNIFQFTPDMPTNHKFFNFFLIGGTMLTAYLLMSMWKTVWTRGIVIILIFFLTISGIIDFFPVYNDSKMTIDDYKKNPDIAWIKNNTPPESVFLNSIHFFAPESIAGRKILFGWPYFSWGAGYNTISRDIDRKNMLAADDKIIFCTIAQKYSIRYASLKKTQLTDDTGNTINHNFFNNNFPLVYSNTISQVMIYSTNSCHNLND